MALWLGINGLLIIVAYLLGSIPTGYLAGRLLKGIDIREHGSGSTGATNVLRTLGKGPALVVFAIDIFKGLGAIALIYGFYQTSLLNQVTPEALDPAIWQPWLVALSGLMALLGHSKSIWLKFTGGKSVATSLGILLAMAWPVALGTLAVFGVVLGIFQIVSLGSVAGAIAVIGLMIVFQQPLPYQLFAIAGGVYVIWRHRSNMERLLAGTEPRIGQKMPQAASENTVDNVQPGPWVDS